MVGVGVSVIWPNSITAPTKACSSSWRPASTSCNMDVLCCPTACAPAMRFSKLTLNCTPSLAPMFCASVIMLAASSRVAGKTQMSSNVACVNALMGLKLKLPHTLSQISERMSLDTGALKPAALNASLMARMLGVSLPSISPNVKRLPSITLITPGRITSLAG